MLQIQLTFAVTPITLPPQPTSVGVGAAASCPGFYLHACGDGQFSVLLCVHRLSSLLVNSLLQGAEL